MTRRLIESCARIAETTNTLQDLAKTKERQDIEQLKGLNADLVHQAYLQVAAHAFIAVLCVGAVGTLAAYTANGGEKPICDAASAVTVINKFGEAGTTGLRAGETSLQGKQRIVDHRLNKGPEKRFDEFFQQYIRSVQEYQAALGKARGA